MRPREILQTMNFCPSKDEIAALKKESDFVIKVLKKEIRRRNISAEVFTGGSFAKGTMVKKIENDIDIFVRFDKRYKGLSKILEKIIGAFSKKEFEIKRIHGSRDYFSLRKKNIVFEIVPTLRIKRPEEAENVTDLSYFHVNYIKKRIDKKLANQIVLAKTFCKAHGIYGAESYIGGFSGYGLECLIAHYGSFEKMLKYLAYAKEKIIIDPGKKYKKRENVFLEINENKLKGPVILIDPTWKERNALAALNKESFEKFQKSARDFLNKPSLVFFEDKDKLEREKIAQIAKKFKAEFIVIEIKTNKQSGDIAGTKLKKFYNFIIREIGESYNIIKSVFYYGQEQTAEIYLVLSNKGDKIRVGPLKSMSKHVKAFKKIHKNAFEKNGRIYAIERTELSAGDFFKNYRKSQMKKIKEMNVTRMTIKNGAYNQKG